MVRPDGTKVKLEHTLEQAATVLDIKKKTLDDYLLQLRYARKFKFDFKKNADQPIGTMRNFVSKMRKQELQLKGHQGTLNSSRSIVTIKPGQ